MAAFAANANPDDALGHALWGAGWWLVVLAIINSAVGVGFACTNSASRVMYTMGRAGTLPDSFGRIHRRHHCVCDRFCAVIKHRGNPLVGLLLKPDYIFGFLETIATLAVIVLYVLAKMPALKMRYMRQDQRSNFTVWQHVLAPWIATLALIPVLLVTVYPEPSWPYNITPYLFLVALLFGFAYMHWRESRNPGALRRGRAIMLTSGGETAEGDANPMDSVR